MRLCVQAYKLPKYQVEGFLFKLKELNCIVTLNSKILKFNWYLTSIALFCNFLQITFIRFRWHCVTLLCERENLENSFCQTRLTWQWPVNKATLVTTATYVPSDGLVTTATPVRKDGQETTVTPVVSSLDLKDNVINAWQDGREKLWLLLPRWTGDNCDSCVRGWAGDNCSQCATNFGPPGQCDQCLKGWAGNNCSDCATNFGRPGQCDQCLGGWTCDNCSECADNFGPAGQCDQCLRGWSGENCSDCGTNFGPPGQCDQCLRGWAGDSCDACAPGWTGPECDACEGFGFSTESNCTECIQNGYWKGHMSSRYLDVHLTFTGETCSDLVPGRLISTLYQLCFLNLVLYLVQLTMWKSVIQRQ